MYFLCSCFSVLSLNHKFDLLVNSFLKTHKKNLGTVRTRGTNPCVKQDLPTNKMDLKVLISMREFSQILAAAGNDSHWVKTILTAVESLSTSPKITDKPKS